ncbi:ABC transporter ATP-binding protein [Brevibacterium sp. BRM-1]|uniref:dipeptide ABC transporter ATP-binding protein n=1 Tax=Brevibacterium sp. BRM-1 TaxID=2999062 RepID=UPI002282613B|nr:ABC transporter ATP-binding protein [Brevibacterium sp. BRM-1]WAL40263.1 ABC transporter ATP-binding protein [Brevibacterium sp. BRM-1]
MSAPLLRVASLRVHAGPAELVRGVSFAVAPGERVGLIGESGSGKSLTAAALMGLLPEGLRATGDVELAGVRGNVLTRGERELARVRGRAAGMVFQEPMSALDPLMRVGVQIAEALVLHGAQRAAARARAVEALAEVGLPDPAAAAAAYPHQLSGGQRQRVVLAIALANEPRLLICDEPTTALDVTVQAQVLELIRTAAARPGSGLLFITHDLAVVAEVCTRVLVMHAGEVVEEGPVGRVLTAPAHPYTRGLLAASDLRAVDERGRLFTMATAPAYPAGGAAAGGAEGTAARCGGGAATGDAGGTGVRGGGPETAQEAGPEAVHEAGTEAAPAPVPGAVAGPASVPSAKPTTEQSTGSSSVLASELASGTVAGTAAETGPAAQDSPARTSGAGEGTVAAIEVRGLAKAYRRTGRGILSRGSEVTALAGVSFCVAAGARFGIVGESGSGKSTLLRILAGLEPASGGTATVSGVDVVGAGEPALRRMREDVQVVFQDPFASLDPRMRAADIVAEPLLAQGLSTAERRERAARALSDVGLSAADGQRYPHQFSGGQRQRISIARALAVRPRILLADEPVSALDVSVRAQVLNLLTDLADRYGLTLVFISHDLGVVRHLCRDVIVMQGGRIVEAGTVDDVYERPQHPYTAGLVAATPDLARALARTR